MWHKIACLLGYHISKLVDSKCNLYEGFLYTRNVIFCCEYCDKLLKREYRIGFYKNASSLHWFFDRYWE